MHSMHTLQAHEQMQLQPQTLQSMEAQEQQQQATMTVLESLDPTQQVAGPSNDQQQVVGLIDSPQVQHLVQAQPLLHQLQPSHASSQMEASSNSQQLNAADEQGQIASRNSVMRAQQRPQIEGIVADGGGPIMHWLLENYEIADGESLPRSTVYNHYLDHCRQLQMASVNAASFGKLIRSVFIGLKTRRLGTRGHSKYHYFGVRAKPHIRQELLQYQEGAGRSSRELSHNDNSNQNTDNGSESDSTNNGLECGRLSSSSSGKRNKRASNRTGERANQIYQTLQQQQHELEQQQQQQQQQQEQHIELDSNGAHIQLYYTNGTNGYPKPTTLNHNSGEHMIAVELASQCELADFRNHLGANWTTLVDEHWPQREACLLESQLAKVTGEGELASLIEPFELNYKSYFKRMVELLSELKFHEIEQLWQDFWNPSVVHLHHDNQAWSMHQTNGVNGTNLQNGQQQASDDISHYHQQQQQLHHHQQSVNLTSRHLYQLSSHPLIIERINQIDYLLFAAIESFLLPDILNPIPRPLSQQIRLFAKNIGSWIEMAVKDYEPQFAVEKSKSARAFGYALRRKTSLNHLSTASRAIWEKRSSLAQMSMDLSRVDLCDIEHQVSLMSHSNNDLANTSNLLNAEHLPNPNNNSNSTNEQNVDNNENARRIINYHHHHSHHSCALQPGFNQLIQKFLHLLEDPYPANSWQDWCRNLVEDCVCGHSIDEAKNFVLKWNFYISLIMKELTLRSAPSFGSFQLIRLLFDEYIFYLVVTRLAQAQHKTPAQLLSL